MCKASQPNDLATPDAAGQCSAKTNAVVVGLFIFTVRTSPGISLLLLSTLTPVPQVVLPLLEATFAALFAVPSAALILALNLANFTFTASSLTSMLSNFLFVVTSSDNWEFFNKNLE